MARVFQKCFKSVAKVFQSVSKGCQKRLKALQKRYKSVTKALQKRYKSVTQVFQSVSNALQTCFKVFRGCCVTFTAYVVYHTVFWNIYFLIPLCSEMHVFHCWELWCNSVDASWPGCQVGSMSTQWAPSEHPMSTQWAPSEHQVSTKWAPSEHQVSTQWAPSEWIMGHGRLVVARMWRMRLCGQPDGVPWLCSCM